MLRRAEACPGADSCRHRSARRRFVL